MNNLTELSVMVSNLCNKHWREFTFHRGNRRVLSSSTTHLRKMGCRDNTFTCACGSGFRKESRSDRAGWFFLVSSLALFLILGFPGQALAFGPATHIDLGLSVLRYAAILPPLMRKLLKSHPDAFLYGGFAADQVVGKNMAQQIHHCHNWNVGFRMLDAAPNERIKALCWGFLSHLAADVIAHNYYVPMKVLASYRSRMTRHVYWEVRYDQVMHASESVWATLKHLGGERFPEEDSFLREELSRASRVLPYEVSRGIFNSIMLLNRAERWREMISNAADRSPWKLREDDLHTCNKMALDAVCALLIDGKRASPVKVDPTGMTVLAEAKQLRKKLKRKMKKGILAERLSPATEDRIGLRLQEALSPGFNEDGSSILPRVEEILEWEKLETPGARPNSE